MANVEQTPASNLHHQPVVPDERAPGFHIVSQAGKREIVPERESENQQCDSQKQAFHYLKCSITNGVVVLTTCVVEVAPDRVPNVPEVAITIPIPKPAVHAVVPLS